MLYTTGPESVLEPYSGERGSANRAATASTTAPNARICAAGIPSNTVRRTAGETQAARLRREARVAARLGVPGVCKVYDVGDRGGILFIAMELLSGSTIRARWEEAKSAATLPHRSFVTS